MKIRMSRPVTALVAVGLMFGVAGCSDSPASGGSEATTGDSAAVASEDQADAVTVKDAWVKAADDGMSAGFGVFVNDSDGDVTVVGAASEASLMIELHETVEDSSGQMIMQEKEAGFTIPAGSEYLLEPGANHLMLMDLPAPMTAGDTVEFSIEFEDETTLTFSAPVKDYTGANENYVEE